MGQLSCEAVEGAFVVNPTVTVKLVNGESRT